MFIKVQKSKEEKENIAKEIVDINTSIDSLHEKINEYKYKFITSKKTT